MPLPEFIMRNMQQLSHISRNLIKNNVLNDLSRLPAEYPELPQVSGPEMPGAGFYP